MSTTWAAANDPQPAMAHLASGPSPASRRPSSTTQRAPSPFLTERRSYAPRAPERGRGSLEEEKEEEEAAASEPATSLFDGSRRGTFQNRTKQNKANPASQPDGQTDTALPIEAELLFSSPSLSQAPLQDALLGLSVTHYSFINVRSFLLSSVIR
ncbi:hypothetical protein DTO164E3_844 [Paecilomyces variotii]|nr:hypothetical protein DTO164E3_844 [Paecilomyces variotii]KAJ9232263.1 hypothetical protein DTO169E5_7565 [Paecilomyces variotii]KAJ9358217.1 hypothetical protein DTO280E4_5326 [Paecilomyces variotii]